MGTTTIKVALATGLALGASAFGASGASATPAFDHGLTAVAGQNVEQVRWVCGPFRCWWRPGWGWGHRWGWGHPWAWGDRWG